MAIPLTDQRATRSALTRSCEPQDLILRTAGSRARAPSIPPPAPPAHSPDPSRQHRITSEASVKDQSGAQEREYVLAQFRRYALRYSPAVVDEILDRLLRGRSTREEFVYACAEADAQKVYRYVYLKAILNRVEGERLASAKGPEQATVVDFDDWRQRRAR